MKIAIYWRYALPCSYHAEHTESPAQETGGESCHRNVTIGLEAWPGLAWTEPWAMARAYDTQTRRITGSCPGHVPPSFPTTSLCISPRQATFYESLNWESDVNNMQIAAQSDHFHKEAKSSAGTLYFRWILSLNKRGVMAK